MQLQTKLRTTGKKSTAPQVSLGRQPVVAAVWVTMSPGAFQKFAIFVVEIRGGNTAEYKPCATFEGRFTEQLAKFQVSQGIGIVWHN